MLVNMFFEDLATNKRTLLKPGEEHVGLNPDDAEVDEDPQPPVIAAPDRDEQFVAEENALEALADVGAPADADDSSSRSNLFLTVDGKSMHKGSLIHSIFKRGITSTDRLKRVRGYARFSVETNDEDDLADSRKQVVDIGDLFLCSTVALLMVEVLPVRPMSIARLATAGTVVEGKILRLVENPDPDAEDDSLFGIVRSI